MPSDAAPLVVPEPKVAERSAESPVARPCPAVASVAAATIDSTGLAEDDPARPLMEKGIAALDDASVQTALAYFQQALRRNPDNPQIPITAATAALQHNQPKVAVSLLTPLAPKMPKSAVLRRILGVAYYRLGDYPSSQSALRQALSFDKSSALTYFLMGCTLAKLGQRDEAEAHFRQAEALDPRYASRR